MQWQPATGHVPRGFIGAIGSLDEIEAVFVIAEPGNPRDGEQYDEHGDADRYMEKACGVARGALASHSSAFHRNVRQALDLFWPQLKHDLDAQLRRVWITESVLCSAKITTGPIEAPVWRACVTDYLAQQLRLLPGRPVFAFGGKAVMRLRGQVDVMSAVALAPPGANRRDALPSWRAAAAAFHATTRRPTISR